jgi:hypothetical protein
MLNVGTNFAPEHLEEMFEEPRLGIRRMEMRFRPYVEQATYYQFLKGMCLTITSNGKPDIQVHTSIPPSRRCIVAGQLSPPSPTYRSYKTLRLVILPRRQPYRVWRQQPQTVS